MPIRIAVDAMGGDEAPDVVVEGTARALHQLPQEVELLFLGPRDTVETALEQHEEAAGLPFRIVDAPDVIGMGEAPTAAVKSKRRSSIHLGLKALEAGKVDAFVSAGNTGAVMAASVLILGRLPGVLRPAALNLYPTTRGETVALDAGSNVDCKPEHLVQFAKMGSVYARRILEIEDPAVGLLNIGEEPGKGNEQVKAAYELLTETEGIRFCGNVEGREVMHGRMDVIVCDGFVGNIMLKFGEGLVTAYPEIVAQEIERQGLGTEEQKLVGQMIRAVTKRLNYEEYGGTPLLGVAGNVMLGHGSSSVYAFERLIHSTVRVAEQDLSGYVASQFTS